MIAHFSRNRHAAVVEAGTRDREHTWVYVRSHTRTRVFGWYVGGTRMVTRRIPAGMPVTSKVRTDF